MRSIIVLAVAVIAVTLAGSSAHANDEKVYPGLACQSNSGSLGHFAGQGLNYSSTGGIWVRCPIVKDADWGYTPGQVGNDQTQPFSATARIIDQHPSQSVRCFVLSYHPWVSGAFSYSARSSPSGASSDPYELWFSPVATSYGVHHVLRCQVPPRDSAGRRSGVINYRVFEAGD
jgi:hypothetical protein